jgi:two-component system chemotaxis response regulator CheB
MSNGKIKVLIVDDSAIVRKVLTDTLSGERDIEVVGAASDPYFARDKILALNPDVLTLDIEMPRMDGLTFLAKLMQYRPMPVVMISSLAQSSCDVAVEALRRGAVEVLAKPSGPFSVGELRIGLANKIRAAAAARNTLLRGQAPEKNGTLQNQTVHSVTLPPSLEHKPASKPTPSPTGVMPVVSGVSAPALVHSFSDQALIAIGASTGGVTAITQVLTSLPGNMPGIVVTQHIPAGFSRAFAERLNQLCALSVKEAEDGDLVQPGRALVAPGDRHMIVQRGADGYSVAVKDGPLVSYQRPSVDVLFHSVARVAGKHAIGAILTGMGADGAEGLLAMKRAGSTTIAQDEQSCVVFGMPREAINRGAVDRVCPLSEIAASIQAALV